MQVLLVQDNLEDEQLLTEVLIEMEENRQWCNWRNASVVHVEQLADALKCLRENRFDVVLLNLTLPDSPALLDSFHKVNDCAQAAPILILADEDDPNLAHLLLREGAQDVLLKSELETKISVAKAEELKGRYSLSKQQLDISDSSISAQLDAQKVQIEKLKAAYELKKQQVEELVIRAASDGVLQQLGAVLFLCLGELLLRPFLRSGFESCQQKQGEHERGWSPNHRHLLRVSNPRARHYAPLATMR